MKRFVNKILNEARVLRTIDAKIWASMSSMTSRLRATLGEDAKPMKKDDINTLLQKYVAGLLTMKAPCPNNVSEIDDIKAYKLIGNAYINAGGSISNIQKLYVENGGKLSDGATIARDSEPVGTVSDMSDDITNVDNRTLDDIEDEIISQGMDDIDNSVETSDIDDMPSQQYDFNKEVQKRKEPAPVTPAIRKTDYDAKAKMELSNTLKYINTYLKRNREILAANTGSLLAFDEDTGMFTIIDSSSELLPICTGRGFSNVDKKTRFMVIGNTEYELGNAGNNGVYDDYYFRKSEGSNGRLQIKAGSNYYMDEDTKGKFYTEILAENGMIPAMHVLDVVSECDITDPNALEVLKVSAYLPTLPELVKIINMLPPGTYWTSSIGQNGNTNIALQVRPDRVLSQCTSAKVIAFIRFD